MKRNLIIACIVTLFSVQMFGQAVITKAEETSVTSNNKAGTSTIESASATVNTGTATNGDNLKDVGSYKNESYEYNVKKDDTHKYIELSYYIGNEHSVTIPNSIDGIPVEVLKGGVFAFNKTDIYDVTIPKSVKLIQCRAFDGTIENYHNCYYGSAGLRNVKILGKDTKLENDSFYECGHLIKIEADNNVFDNTDCEMFINSAYSHNGACSIASPFQSNNTKDGLFILGDKLVFDHNKNVCRTVYSNDICSFARNLEVPEGVKIISKDSFCYSKYQSIIIPKSVEKIEKGAFEGCEIENIYIPNKDVTIEDGAFDSSVKIYKGDDKPLDQNILKYSYTKEGILKGYFGDDEVVQVPSEINGTKITSIGGEIAGLPEAPVEITKEQEEFIQKQEKSVFSCYSNAEKVVIPEGITEINDYSFYYCPNLKEVVIPKTVTKISENAFYGCNDLIKITTPNKDIATDCKEYKDALANDGKEKQNVYNGYQYYKDADNGKEFIHVCGYVGTDKKLVIPDKINDLPVTSVGGINNNKDIEEITVPKSVTSISGFEDCTSLSKISIEGNPNFDKDVFKNTSYLDNIYKNNNGLFIFNHNIISVQDGMEVINVPATVEGVSIDTFDGDFKEIDLTSSTKVTIKDSSGKDVICKTTDDYKNFAKQIQKGTDYYFTLKLDGKTVWSNETGTDVPDKITPERYDVNAYTGDSRNMALLLLLPASLALAAKFKQKNKKLK